MVGQTLSHYKILEKLGSGGMGEVYRAKDLELGRDVAIKVLREELASDPDRLRRFEQEARSASALNHPNIIHIYEVGKHGTTPYIAMELVEGQTLRELLAVGPLPLQELLQLATQIAEGLAKAHSAGIIHRDLKPANLMVNSDGYVKILDFGLAKLMPGSGVDSEAATATKEGTVAGTASYMSPEQALGKPLDARTDVFSLGAVLYEMATGSRPFQGETPAGLFDEILNKTPAAPSTRNPELTGDIDGFINKALEKDPGQRHPSAREMRVDLGRLSAPAFAMAPRRKALVDKRLLLLGGLAAVAVMLLLLNVGGLRDRLLGGSNSGPIESIAVLPLENLSGDPEQEYFADGMTDELIAQLAKINALTVISRTSVMQYKGARKPLPEIARDLNVNAVVEGTVRRSEGRVRITAQLIEAASDRHLWAESYERDYRDVLSLQSEVAYAIAKQIEIELSPEEESLLTSTLPVDIEAYEAYLKGRFYHYKMSADGFEKAIEYFNLALSEDSNYALAHAGLANSYRLAAFWGYASVEEAMPKAREAALKALAIDDTLAEAHFALGGVRFLGWDWLPAQEALRRAIVLNPSYAQAHMTYANYLMSVGRMDEGLVETTRARQLDPISVYINTLVAAAFRNSGRIEEAISILQEVLEIDPNFFLAHLHLGRALRQKGDYEGALRQAEKTYSLMGNLEVAEAIRSGYASSDYNGAMKAAADKLSEQSQGRVLPAFVALLYADAGEKDRALQWLERAFEERSPALVFIKSDPDMDILRSETRFQELVQRMNFPE